MSCEKKNCDLIIKAKYILPLDEKTDSIKDGMVVVSGKKIIAVGTLADLNNKYKAEKEIDAKNSIVMPGMVNTHTHAAMAYFRGLADDLPLNEWLNKHIWPAEAKYINPEFIENSSRLACLEMIKSGVTCFNDMYFFADITARIAEKAGLRACLGEAVLDFPTPSGKSPQEAINKTKVLYKNYKNHDLIDIFAAPHSIYTCDKDTLLEVKEMSAEYNMPIHIHLCETKKEIEDSKKKHKKTPIKYLDKLGFLNNNVIAAHSVWLNDNDLEIYKKRKVSVSHNPISNMKLASGIAPVPEMLLKKITVGLGTDGAASNNSLDLFSEMRVCTLLHKADKLDPTVVKARDAVKMATIYGAKVLGLDDKIGSLETGKNADIITINMDKPHLSPLYDPYSSLVYGAAPQDVENVIVSGKIIMENGVVKTMDEEKILKDGRFFKFD